MVIHGEWRRDFKCCMDCMKTLDGLGSNNPTELRRHLTVLLPLVTQVMHSLSPADLPPPPWRSLTSLNPTTEKPRSETDEITNFNFNSRWRQPSDELWCCHLGYVDWICGTAGACLANQRPFRRWYHLLSSDDISNYLSSLSTTTL